jgi:hypothetical protein
MAVIIMEWSAGFISYAILLNVTKGFMTNYEKVSKKEVTTTEGRTVVKCCGTCALFLNECDYYENVEVWPYYVCDSFKCDEKNNDQLRKS